MVSGRRARALSWVQPIKMMPALEPVTPTVSRSARPESSACWRRGGGCRKDKDLYGWVCAVCADELDLYYLFWLGLRGGRWPSCSRRTWRRIRSRVDPVPWARGAVTGCH